MNKPNLSFLYRQATRDVQNAARLPDPDTLLAMTRGEHALDNDGALAELAESGLHVDLLRFARALEAPSQELSIEALATINGRQSGHVQRRFAKPRHAGERQRATRRSIFAAIAAALIVSIGVWSNRGHIAGPASPASATAIATTQNASPDRIFAALNEHGSQSTGGDVIFRTDFPADVIFKSKSGG